MTDEHAPAPPVASAERLTLTEVRDWMLASLEALEAEGITEVPLNRDGYWTVYFDQAFDIDPPEPVYGSIADDIEDLRSELGAIRSGEGASAAWHMLLHLGGITGLLANHSASGPSAP